MKTMRPGKRILALALCVMLFVGLLPASAFAATEPYMLNGEFHFYDYNQLKDKISKVKANQNYLGAVYEGTGAFVIPESVTFPSNFKLYLTAEEVNIASGATVTLQGGWFPMGGIKWVTVNGTLVNNASLTSGSFVLTVNGTLQNNAPISCKSLSIKGTVMNSDTIECTSVSGKDKLANSTGASLVITREAAGESAVKSAIKAAAGETRTDITYRVDAATSITLNSSLTIPERMVLRVGTDPNQYAQLTMAAGTTIVNQGQILVLSMGSKLSIEGTLVNQGLVFTNQGGTIELAGGNYQESSYGRIQVKLPYDSDDGSYYSEADSYLSGFNLNDFNHTVSGGSHFYRLKSQSKQNGWIKVGSDWYYLKNGKMLTSAWQKDGKGWCYLGDDGKMVKNGWAKDSAGWCYLKSDGHMATKQWIDYKGKWYYVDASGHMLTGWQKIGGKQYYLKDSGAMAVGWTKIGGNYYYFKDSGVMLTKAWQKDGKGWCYVGADGKMLTSTWQEDGKGWCYIKSDGRIAVNQWVQDGSSWYYMDASGHIAKGWQEINGKWYYLGTNGVMVTGWQKISGKWYYFKDSGAMKTGWLKLDGKWYYLDTNGAMVTGTKTINGKSYTFNGSGVCQNP